MQAAAAQAELEPFPFWTLVPTKLMSAHNLIKYPNLS